jgi:uncharacterized protein (UPF0332 family)
MKEFAATEWQRAVSDLAAAKKLVDTHPDAAASRAYYAAFHALPPLFALRGQTFSKHSAIRASLHRDLIRPSEWSADLGEAYELLVSLRHRGDDGGLMGVSLDEAKTSVGKAAEIIEAVRRSCTELDQRPSSSMNQGK